MTVSTKNVSLFNCAQPEVRQECEGLLLPRVPESVRHTMSPRGRFISMSSTGVEIRFVTTAEIIRVMLSTLGHGTHITVYRGMHEHSDHVIEHGKLNTIHLEAPTTLNTVDRRVFDSCSFKHEVWRIVIRNGTVYYHGIDCLGADVRPPLPDEIPSVRWLAYGSSITNATAKGYIHHAARQLGVDVMNLGMSGACRIEPELSDYMASLDWDFATCELGINMRGDIPPRQFRKLTEHMLDAFAKQKPGKPVGLISPFPSVYEQHVDEHVTIAKTNLLTFGQILQELAESRKDQGVFMIPGNQIMNDFAYLHTDLVHPSDFGHAQMGHNLAGMLRRQINHISDGNGDMICCNGSTRILHH